MNAEILQMTSVIAFSISGILFIAAVILYFRLNVRGLVDDLSGRMAERQIRELREANRQTEGNKNARIPYDTPGERTTSKLSFGKKKEKTSPLAEKNTGRLRAEQESTALLAEEGTALLEEESTTLLAEEGTTLLAEEGTTLLAEEGTTLLAEEGTTLLEGAAAKVGHGCQLLIDVMVIHTEERI